MTDIETDLMLARAEIATLKAELAAQTARADRAEQERDRAIEDVKQSCDTCKLSKEPTCPWEGTYHHKGEHGEKIGVCNAWQWRGLPQKGE